MHRDFWIKKFLFPTLLSINFCRVFPLVVQYKYTVLKSEKIYPVNYRNIESSYI